MNTDAETLRARLVDLEGQLAREHHLARHDPLTGALNRRGGLEAVRELAEPFALALVDLDHFRYVNHLPGGYATGDLVLCETTELLASDARIDDLIIRWGGEEFLLVLIGADVDGAVIRLERFLDEARRRIREGGVMVTFSAGVADAESAVGFEAAFAKANRALEKAKADGRALILAARSTRAA